MTERRDSPELPANQVKHLEFIQTIIGRQASNSFLTKGWALTLTVVFYGFTVNTFNWRLALIGQLPVVAFWWLDAYFLRQERLFRCLYEDARVPTPRIELFSLDTRAYGQRHNSSWMSVLSSITLRVYYGLLAVVGLFLWLFYAIR